MDWMEGIRNSQTWLNENQGVVSVAVFVVALIFGWASGIFSALRRRPKFIITLTPGPTFSCTFLTGAKKEEYDVHRTGIALYLRVANVGTAPSSIDDIWVGYRWALARFSRLWLRYTIGWFWLDYQAIALSDFRHRLEDR